MQSIKRNFFLLLILSLLGTTAQSQLRADFVSNPSPNTLHLDPQVAAENAILLDSLQNMGKPFDPRKATIRSAIVPGWGQIYNKKYWKLPIVYGALGISGTVFFSNLNTYKRLRQAVRLRSDNDPLNDTLIGLDLRPLSTQSLIAYRNTFRQYIDYSVVAFLLLWGLNVVDATVDAHLKGFDVSPNLSMSIKPLYQLDANRGSFGLAFTFEKRHHILPLP